MIYASFLFEICNFQIWKWNSWLNLCVSHKLSFFFNFLIIFYPFFCENRWELGSFSNLWRTTSEEKRELERLEKPMYNSVRQAAEVHRQVANRSFLQLYSCSAFGVIFLKCSLLVFRYGSIWKAFWNLEC